jgi:hypothetical protein
MTGVYKPRLDSWRHLDALIVSDAPCQRFEATHVSLLKQRFEGGQTSARPPLVLSLEILLLQRKAILSMSVARSMVAPVE